MEKYKIIIVIVIEGNYITLVTFVGDDVTGEDSLMDKIIEVW